MVSHIHSMHVFDTPSIRERFAVYFSTADGALSMLCPVAPFGTRIATAALAGLTVGLEPGTATTSASWLQRAVPDAPPALLQGVLDAADDTSAAVQPHALGDHCPVLQGPLPVQAPPGEGDAPATLMGLCEEDDAVVCMTVIRCVL